jgi:hypothetical protein
MLVQATLNKAGELGVQDELVRLGPRPLCLRAELSLVGPVAARGGIPEGWDRLAVLTNRPAPMVPEDTMVVKWLVRAAPGGSRVEGCWAARAGGRTRPR